jgi:hypothetical protein
VGRHVFPRTVVLVSWHYNNLERKKNVYGTYEKKSITTDDEFEFDTDNDDEDEDAYAMSRESQVFTTDVNTDELDGNCIEYKSYTYIFSFKKLII